jgi:hypothetical protein
VRAYWELYGASSGLSVSSVVCEIKPVRLTLACSPWHRSGIVRLLIGRSWPSLSRMVGRKWSAA